MADKTKAEMQEEMDLLKAQLEEAQGKAKEAEEAQKKAKEAAKMEASHTVSMAPIAPDDSEAEQHRYMNEKVPFYAIKDNDKYKDDIQVCVNGKITVIQRGKQVMIPRYVAEVLADSERQKVKAADTSQGFTDKFFQKQNFLT